MEFKYVLTESDLVTAMKLHGQGSKRVQVALVSLGVLLSIIAIFASYKFYAILIIAGGVIGYFAVYFFVIPFQAKKQYRELKSIQSEMRLRIEDKGIMIESCIGNSNLDWSHFKKWAYNESIIIMYITSRMFYMLPRRVLENEEQFESILEILSNNIGKNA